MQGRKYTPTAVSYDFDNDGWPDIYVAVDSQPSVLFRNNHDGTFTDVAVISGVAYSENRHEETGMGIGVGEYGCGGWVGHFKKKFSAETLHFCYKKTHRNFLVEKFVSSRR